MIEKRPTALFHSSDEAESRNEWLKSSMATLGAAYDAGGTDTEAAASILVKELPFADRRRLAYSAYCFWCEPLLEHAQAHPQVYGSSIKGVPDAWALNGFTKALLWVDNSSEAEAVKQETFHRLHLAATAFRAVTTEETGYDAYIDKKVTRILERIEGDKELQILSRNWPEIKNNKGEALLDALKKNAYYDFIKAGYPDSELSKLRKLGLADVATKASTIVFETAKEALFSDASHAPLLKFPAITPGILLSHAPHEMDGSGGYYLSPDGSQGGYTFNEYSLGSFASLPHFLIGCIHETEHLAQWTLAKNAVTLRAPHPLAKAVEIFADEFLCGHAVGSDQPRSLYAGLPNASPPMKAYFARPTEFYTYKQQAILNKRLLPI
jgi:hypothetical protein